MMTHSFDPGGKVKFNQNLIESQIRQHQQLMNLGCWRILIRKGKNLKNSILELRTVRERCTAIIYYQEGYETTLEELHRAIIHELVHLHLDNLREEHDLQQKYAKNASKDEYKERFDNEIEKSVESLSNVLYDIHTNGYSPW